jgi:hypothetical protein
MEGELLSTVEKGLLTKVGVLLFFSCIGGYTDPQEMGIELSLS